LGNDPPLLDRASPLRSSHLRDPVGPQIHFASESFMDEIASTIGVDPLELRLRYVKMPATSLLLKQLPKGQLAIAALAAARPDRHKVQAAVLPIRQRNGTRVAIVRKIEVDRTPAISVRKFTVAHDCGQIITRPASSTRLKAT